MLPGSFQAESLFVVKPDWSVYCDALGVHITMGGKPGTFIYPWATIKRVEYESPPEFEEAVEAPVKRGPGRPRKDANGAA